MDEEPIYKAIPVYVTPSSAEDSSIDTTSSFKSVMELSSDSDKSIERTYNLNSGKVYEKLPESTHEVITGSKNPLGVKTEIKSNKLDLVFDENHNSAESLITKNLDMDPEIQHLKEQHLVKTLLGQFSRSSPSLNDASMYKETPQVTNTSISDLKSKFNCKQDLRNDKFDQIYSLTARSIPSQVRKELQETQSQTIEISADTSESEEFLEDKEFPAAKSRIQFFENLKH